MLRENYHCINASAGSGKTFSLVQKILYICLEKQGHPQAIQHILALTFTNKAANEMKQRLLNWLELFSQDSAIDRPEFVSMMDYFKSNKNPIKPDVLIQRAKACKDYLLHHYSVFSLSTIDKFNTKLVRSFAQELGLSTNFALEINAKPYLTESVDATLSELGQDEQLTKVFMEYLKNMRDLDISTDIARELIQKTSVFKDDLHYFELEKNKDLDLDSFEQIKTKILATNLEIWREIQKLAQEADEIIKTSGFGQEAFPQKGRSIHALFQKIIGKKNMKQAVDFFGSNSQDTYFTGKTPKGEIGDLCIDLVAKKNQIYALNKDYLKNQLVLENILPLSVNKKIQDKLKEIEEDKDIMLLHNFNRIIYENLKNEVSGFIYEKIDAKYQHFFFDEFQDTSYMQWQNFLPLRDNCLDQENTSFTLVGDPKQSIYKFRGGDPKIMTDIINHKEDGAYFAQIHELKDNYRSSQNIINFNNELYAFIAQDLDENYAPIFGISGQQNVKSKDKGYVKGHLIYAKNKSTFYQGLSDKLVEDIQDIVNNGFSFSDICILCRKNKEIATISKYLSDVKIRYKGESKYIRTYSEKGLKLNISNVINALMAFLNWVDQPSQYKYLVQMLYALQQSQRIVMEDFTLELQEILQSRKHSDILQILKDKYQLNLSLDQHNRLNLYNYIEQYINELSVDGEESHFIVNFLEMLYAYTQNNKASIKDFLNYWEEESDNFSIQVSESVDAIKFMTIHGSKGLEFPVVLLPFFIESDVKFSNWLDVEEMQIEGLSSIHIGKPNNTLAKADEKINEFKESNLYSEKIDSICNTYVATTRAVEQLFVYAQYKPLTKEGVDNNIDITRFLIEKGAQEPAEDESSSFEVFESTAQDREKQKEHRRNEGKVAEIVHQKLNTDLSNSKIKIATASKKEQKYQEEVKIGLLIHGIFEKMQKTSDIPVLLEKLLMNGDINQQQEQQINLRIQNLIQNPQYAEYFNDQNEFMAEAEFMVELDGVIQNLRPDRLVKIDGQWVILDFKTGAEHEQYDMQVEGYKSALEKLGYTIAKTDILYL